MDLSDQALKHCCDEVSLASSCLNYHLFDECSFQLALLCEILKGLFFQAEPINVAVQFDSGLCVSI